MTQLYSLIMLDEAEQTIFTASDDAIGDGLVGVNDVLESAIERIEEIENRGTGLSGLPTYFSDLPPAAWRISTTFGLPALTASVSTSTFR